MASYSYGPQSGRASALRGLSYRDWPRSLGESARRTLVRIRTGVAPLTRRLAGVTPDQWFLVGFVILFLVFFLILLVQPSGVGRGGR